MTGVTLETASQPAMARGRRWLAHHGSFVRGRRDRRPILATALILETSSAGLLLAPAPTLLMMAVGMVVHIGASALLMWAQWGNGVARAKAILCGVVALLAFPLVGMVGMVTGIAMVTYPSTRPRGLAMPSVLTGSDDISRIVESRRPVDVEGELAIEPIVDLLRDEDIDVKREAIDALVRVDRQLAVGVLQSLIRDPVGDVRLYASIALSRIEDDVAREMLVARQAVADAPADASARERLGSLYADYGTSGLVNGGTRRRFLALARDEYRVVGDLALADAGPVSALGRVHILCGEWETARAELGNALARDPRCVEARLGLMEVAFETGDLVNLVRHAASARLLVDRDHPRRALVEWWATTKEVANGPG